DDGGDYPGWDDGQVPDGGDGERDGDGGEQGGGGCQGAGALLRGWRLRWHGRPGHRAGSGCTRRVTWWTAVIIIGSAPVGGAVAIRTMSPVCSTETTRRHPRVVRMWSSGRKYSAGTVSVIVSPWCGGGLCARPPRHPQAATTGASVRPARAGARGGPGPVAGRPASGGRRPPGRPARVWWGPACVLGTNRGDAQPWYHGYLWEVKQRHPPGVAMGRSPRTNRGGDRSCPSTPGSVFLLTCVPGSGSAASSPRGRNCPHAGSCASATACRRS